MKGCRAGRAYMPLEIIVELKNKFLKQKSHKVTDYLDFNLDTAVAPDI